MSGQELEILEKGFLVDTYEFLNEVIEFIKEGSLSIEEGIQFIDQHFLADVQEEVTLRDRTINYINSLDLEA
jgi:hypothetical protein